MKRFERADEGDGTKLASERLLEFTKALWDALVPDSGECQSVQGELVRARERLHAELLRNGLCNYYYQHDERESLSDNGCGSWLLFVLDTLIENRGGHSKARTSSTSRRCASEWSPTGSGIFD